MIGPRCKRGDALSRGVLIARALLKTSLRPRRTADAPETRCAALRGTRAPPGRSAAHRSAVLAAGARPVPFRTRKLSRPAPMVLRGKPVGEQGAADRWTALRRRGGPRGMFPRGPPLFCVPRCRGGRRIASRFQSVSVRRVRTSFLFQADGLFGDAFGSSPAAVRFGVARFH